jgi:hypothetical protein
MRSARNCPSVRPGLRARPPAGPTEFQPRRSPWYWDSQTLPKPCYPSRPARNTDICRISGPSAHRYPARSKKLLLSFGCTSHNHFQVIHISSIPFGSASRGLGPRESEAAKGGGQTRSLPDTRGHTPATNHGPAQVAGVLGHCPPPSRRIWKSPAMRIRIAASYRAATERAGTRTARRTPLPESPSEVTPSSTMWHAHHLLSLLLFAGTVP